MLWCCGTKLIEFLLYLNHTSKNVRVILVNDTLHIPESDITMNNNVRHKKASVLLMETKR